MKMNIRKYMIPTLACGLLLAASCVEETSRFEGGEGESVDTGYLSFDKLEMTVEERTENVNHHPESYAKTRAANVDVESYTVEILDAAGNPVEVTDATGATGPSFAYGDRPERIELPVGSYTLSVYSDETPDVAWEGMEGTPTYGTTQNFTIAKGMATALQDMTCRLLTVKVTVRYKDTLIATMSKNTTAELVLGEDKSLVFEGKEPDLIGYLKPDADRANPLVLYLTTNFNGKEIVRQPLNVAADAKAGQYRDITVGLQNAEDGTVIINAEIETWMENDEIVVDSQKVTVTAFCEERIPDENDPDAPKLTWPGHSLDEIFTLDASMFDENKYFIGNADLTVTTKAPMVSFIVGTTSSNDDFNEDLAVNGLTEPVDLATVDGPARTMLRLWGFPAENLQVTERSFRLTPLMKVLYDYEGMHTFTLTIADEAGRKSTFELKIAVQHDTGDGPKIVWPGHNLGTRYETFAGMEVNLDLSIPRGVRSLWVEIRGALEEGLAGMMPSSFELTEPGDISEALNGFGFPTGDGVKDQTALTFSISAGLIDMMSVFEGDTDFRLVITDNAGQQAEATIMLRVPEQN